MAKDRTDFLMLLLTFLYFANFYPFYVEQWFISCTAATWAIFTVIWGGCICLSNYTFKSPSKSFNRCTVIILLYLAFHYLLHRDADTFSYIFSVVASWIGVFFINSSLGFDKFIQYFQKWQVIMLAFIFLGLPLFVLGYLSPLDSHVIGENEYTVRSIVTYGFFNTKVSSYIDDDFLRPAGWYEEPGSLSFVLILGLLINLALYGNKRIENLFLYGGLVSLSAAHIVLTAIYVFLFKLRMKANGIFVVLIAIVSVVTLYYTLPTDGVGGFIREATFGRMEDMQQGDTHGRNYDAAKVAMFDSFWFGEGDAAIRKAHPEATPETFYYQVAKFGFFGIVIYYLYIVYGTIANRKKDNYFKIFIILALLAWQRPSFLYPLYIVFFYILYHYCPVKVDK